MGGIGGIWVVVAGVIGVLIGGATVVLVERVLSRSKLERTNLTAAKLLEDAQTRSKEIELAAEKGALARRNQAESDAQKRLQELRREDERIQQRREALDTRIDRLEEREGALNKRQSRIDKLKNEIEGLHTEQTAELERVANLSREEAREQLLKEVEAQTRDEMARIIRQVENEAKRQADQKAREIVTLAIQRCAAEQVAETTVAMVSLPNDDMKGRIIGRSGRNIRAIEKATGVDVIVDDTPEAIILSSFDPVRREIARIAVSRLVTDGRIHPGRIEKIMEKATEEVNATIREEGEQAVLDVGVPGVHPELVKLLGRLKFRTSYGQNVLLHSIQTAHLAGMMASELGANVALAKEGGLLHDIGKAVDHDVEGPHAAIGADLAQRYGRSARVINCVAAHHGESEPQCLEAILVEAADAISGARPGARRESLENYLKRVKGLEDIADSFDGVSQSYAIQAGREIRIIVKPDDIDDLAAIQLSKDVARRVEDSLQYPGQIKVTVIRETRAVDFAK
ncbi:MAG: ribonuclease Y [Anaerolineae bacterium]|nr:ribonuclease Y [Anaerolineae bacterium]